MPTCVSIMCTASVHGGQKRASELLERDFELVMRHCIGGLNPGFSYEQKVLFTAEPSLQLQEWLL